MADVIFNEDRESQGLSQFTVAQKKNGFSQFVIKCGLAKDEAGAQRFLLIISILCVLFAVAFVVFGTSKKQPKNLDLDGKSAFTSPQRTN